MGEFDVAEALSRGGRLDEAGPGHGIGLSIATELVEAAGGSLSIARSAIGGLNVTLAWTLSGSAALLQQ
jgi:K+-sensing histidine kinase KdpD